MDVKDSIGVFDSGIGGLTVLKEIRRLLPHENLIYLGDTARVPYGTKSPETVVRYSIGNSLFLLEQGIKAVVIACNTASAHGLAPLQKHFKVPVIGVIGPGARSALKISKNKKIGVMGTEGTIRSEAYQMALKALDGTVSSVGAACPLLVGLAEEGWTDGEVVDLVLKKYLSDLKKQNIDTLILGCTHYPLFKDSVAKFMGAGVTLVDSAVETAADLDRVLRDTGMLNPGPDKGWVKFYSTDAPHRMQSLGHLFLGEKPEAVQQVDITF